MAGEDRGGIPRGVRTLALVLATVGLFGLTYMTVSQRTREFGIRAALGASPRRVMGLVLREGILLTLPGVALGLAGAAVAGRLVASGLVGVSPTIPRPTPPVPRSRTAVAFSRACCRHIARRGWTRWWRCASTRSYLADLTFV